VRIDRYEVCVTFLVWKYDVIEDEMKEDDVGVYAKIKGTELLECSE